MNIAEFELALGKAPLNPKSFSAFQTLTFQVEYTPEDFLLFMSQGSNPAYSVNRQKSGLNTYKYSVVSLAGGYIFTIVSDQVQTNAGIFDFLKRLF